MKVSTDHVKKLAARLAQCATVAMLVVPLLAQGEKKEFKYTVGPGASVTVVNRRGAITVKAGAGRQVIITANTSSDKVEVDASQTGNRVVARTYVLSKGSGEEARVDYAVQIPADADLIIDSGNGAVSVENLRANVTVSAEEGQVDIRGNSGGFIQVQSVNSGITLSNVQKSRVQLASTGGNIQLDGVTGPNVSAKSTTGSLSYTGDFSGGGNYVLTNHSGDIDVSVPVTASVDLTARSMQGSVQNDLPLQKPTHAGVQLIEGRAIAGRANAGSSSVELRSFSGKIRVKKQ